MITTKAQAAEATTILSDVVCPIIGALPHHLRDGIYLETLAGRAYFQVIPAEKFAGRRDYSTPWLHARFDDPARAHTLLPDDRLNKFSGKWNWHPGADQLVRGSIWLNNLRDQLTAIMPLPVDPAAFGEAAADADAQGYVG